MELKPALRLVADKSTPSSVIVPYEQSKEAVAFATRVGNLNAAVPVNAGYLVCVGCRLADAALAFYNTAASHAPSGTFRHGVPAGLKSAEATRAWLETHLEAVRALANDVTQKSYVRADALKESVILASAELDRALGVATLAGLYFKDRHANLFSDANSDLDTCAELAANPPQENAKPSKDKYIEGVFILAGIY